jgi:hypothetical protein
MGAVRRCQEKSLSSENNATIELPCHKLMVEFADAVDTQDYERLRSLFAPDGAFARPTDPDNLIQGRDAA